MAAAQDVLRPTLTRMPAADRSAIVQGVAGVYGSFLLHAEVSRLAYHEVRS
jgi:4-hydroxy 2-oxovalerate aldolase